MSGRRNGATEWADTDLFDGVVDDDTPEPARVRREGSGPAPSSGEDVVEDRTAALDAVDAEDRPDEPPRARGRRRGSVGRTWVPVRAVLHAVVAAPVRLVRGYRTALREQPRAVLIAATVAAVVLALLAGTGAWLWKSAAGSAADREEARAAAVTAVPALLSYDPASVDTILDKTGPRLTDEFRQNYGALITQVVAPAAKNQQITTTAEITGSSVVPAAQAADRNVVLLFVNQTTRSPNAAAPARSGSRVAITLDRVNGRWLVSDLKPV